MDQVASLFAIVSGLVEDNTGYVEKLARGVRNNNPEVLGYIGNPNWEKLRVRGEWMSTTKVSIERPLLRNWIHPWIAKQGYALWFRHTNRILGPDARVAVSWLTNAEIMQGNIPDGLFEAANIAGGLEGLKSSDQYFYRYGLRDEVGEGAGIFVIGAHDASLFLAFVQEKANNFNPNKEMQAGDVFFTTPDTGITEVLF